MKALPPIATVFVVSLIAAHSAAACSIMYEQRTPSQVRAQSNAVSVDRQCRMINGGVYDGLRLGRASDLGNGRIQQVVNDLGSTLLLADCNTREVTMLTGPEISSSGDAGSCGPHYVFADLTGDGAVSSMEAGDDLHELVAMVTQAGGRETNPIEYFFEFEMNNDGETHDVGPNDRFDLLCGCKKYYRNSAGASQ